MEKSNPEISRTFKAYGGEVRKSTDWHFVGPRVCPHCGKMSRPAGGTATPAAGDADYYVVLQGRGFFIEAKYDPQRLSFDAFDANQRAWLDRHGDDSWVWIWLGAGRPNQKDDPRRAWLLRWQVWKIYEGVLQNWGLKGLPYKAHQIEHQKKGLSAPDLLELFELTWAGDSHWEIPSRHPFRRARPLGPFFYVPDSEQATTVREPV